MQSIFGSFHLIAAMSIFVVQKIDEVSRPSLIDRLRHFARVIYEQPAAISLSICQPIACATLLFTNFPHNYWFSLFANLTSAYGLSTAINTFITQFLKLNIKFIACSECECSFFFFCIFFFAAIFASSTSKLLLREAFDTGANTNTCWTVNDRWTNEVQRNKAINSPNGTIRTKSIVRTALRMGVCVQTIELQPTVSMYSEPSTRTASQNRWRRASIPSVGSAGLFVWSSLLLYFHFVSYSFAE